MIEMIIFLIGARGSGKSTLLTIFAYEQQDMMFISNLKINLKNIEEFSMSKLLSDESKHKNFIIDEASLYLDNRRSMSDINVFLSIAINQSRKFQNDFYFAIQNEQTIDKRIKSEIDLFIYCYNYDYYFRYLFYNKYFQLTCSLEIEKYKLENIFELFDTHQLFTNENTSEFMSKYATNNEIIDIAKSNIDKLLKTMKEYNIKKLSEKFVKFYLEKEKIPASKFLIDKLYFEANKILSELK